MLHDRTDGRILHAPARLGLLGGEALRRGVAALALCLQPFAAAGQESDLPTLHDVTGAASDDVLNVRAEPEAGAEKIGELAPDATGVEVTEITGTGGWARVNTGERSGWVSLDFLTARADGTLERVPAFECFGTEPFWNLDVAPGGIATFSEPEGERRYLSGPVTPAEGVRGRFAVLGGGPGRDMALSVRQAACSDGMSDRAYGLAAELLLGGSGARVLSGCCSLQVE